MFREFCKLFRKFLVKPVTKGCIIGLLTALVSVFASIFADKYSEGLLWWFILGITVVIHLTTIILYTKNEKNIIDDLKCDNASLLKTNESINEKLEKSNNRIKDYHAAMHGIMNLCMTCAQYTNKQIHEIIEKGSLDCRTWNFDSASTAACSEIYRSIIENSHVRSYNENGSPDIKISYVKLVDDSEFRKSGDRGDLKIALSGFYHPTNPRQKDLGIAKTIKASEKHYASLFKEDIDKPVFYNGEEYVQKMTGNSNSPYSQYIAFPVRCDTVNQSSKLVGILLVLCYKGCVLSEEVGEIQYLINHFFSTYAYLFLLLFKLDKAMRAMPAKSKNNQNNSAKEDPV